MLAAISEFFSAAASLEASALSTIFSAIRVDASSNASLILSIAESPLFMAALSFAALFLSSRSLVFFSFSWSFKSFPNSVSTVFPSASLVVSLIDSCWSLTRARIFSITSPSLLAASTSPFAVSSACLLINCSIEVRVSEISF